MKKHNISISLLSIILVILIAAGCSGCDWFSPTNPNNGNLSLVWQSKLYTTGLVTGRFPNIIYENRIVITMAQIAEYETKIVGLDIETGRQLWEWKDFFLEKEEGDFYNAILYKNRLVFASGGRHYCIDTETGKTIWKNRTNNATSSVISQLGNKYYYSAPFYDNLERTAVFAGEIETGEIYEIYRLDSGRTSKAPTPFVAPNGDICLAIIQGIKAGSDWTSGIQHYAVLFNHTQNKVLYSQKIGSPDIVGADFRAPVITKGKVYTDIGKGVVCYDAETGTTLWNKSLNGDVLFSHFIVQDDKVYFNCENGYRYALDATTGFVKWQESNTGTCSPIFMMNNVLYYIGGGDGKLYAVDADNGTVIWREDSPNDKKYGFSTVSPIGYGKRIYCCDHYYAYCFEAAK
ncbi:MAG: PQQ-binding-like beta-propeller repeat protein [Ignavibacteria bacterium]|nr:PQQ-binding-like beta-propeller repeat protein [Ignavibacteria bacterium]